MKLTKTKWKIMLGIALLLVAVLCVGIVPQSMAASAGVLDSLPQGGKYESDYDSFEETLMAGRDLNLELAGEGFVLFKNKSNALPLTETAPQVTVLGQSADALCYGGLGSGQQVSPGYAGLSTDIASANANTLFDSLDAVGIVANPTVKSLYAAPALNAGGTDKYIENAKYLGDEGVLKSAESTFASYGDAAIIVLSRQGAEQEDAAANNSTGHTDPDEHYLELNDSEKELFAYAKAQNFDKIIVLINSPAVMELATLQNDDDVDAILWIGQIGWNGIMTVGDILMGDVNPSGRTVDFWMADFTTDPTWYNVGNYTQANKIITGNYTTDGVVTSGRTTVQMDVNSAQGVTADATDKALDYAEGIYMGYKYYETVYTDFAKKDQTAADEWYSKTVVYPFGYGLSYTTFTQEIGTITGDLSDAEGTITVPVTVTNTGLVAGKEVVQLYSNPPYTPGGIEKASANLVGFAKTGMLAAGASATVNVKIAVKDLASFDYNDANGNENFGYELENGKYVLSIRGDSHNILDSKTLTADNTPILMWDEDGNPATPNNIFSQTTASNASKTNQWELYNTLAHNWTEDGGDNYLSREDLLITSAGGIEVALEDDWDYGSPNDLQAQLSWMLGENGNMFKEKAIIALHNQRTTTAATDFDDFLTLEVETDYENLWSKTASDIPDNWTQATGELQSNGRYETVLYDMVGVEYDDPKWTAFMNQLTVQEMGVLFSRGDYQNIELDTIGKPFIVDNDGPGQIKDQVFFPTYRGWSWVCKSVISSTWNTELAYKHGKIVGNESLWINVNGWYAPAMNAHRSPLAGRNFEYFSQDGIQGGKMSAQVVKGATDMGVHVYIKHAFLNDQETNRESTATFATEQSIREIYAKQFELCLTEGNANGTMTAFNHIGVSTALGYAMNIQLYENEWGFDGFSVTDAGAPRATHGWTSAAMLRSVVLPLGSMTVEGTWDASARDGLGALMTGTTSAYNPTQWYWLRESAQRMLYTIVNGNAMDNGFSEKIIPQDNVLTVRAGEIFANRTLVAAADLADLNKVFGGTAGYDFSVNNAVAQEVPQGVIAAIDPITNAVTLTGSISTPGEHNVKLMVKGKGASGYISGLIDAKILVVATTDIGQYNQQFHAGETLVTGVGGNYVPNGATNAANVQKYVKVSYSATGLPEGLSIDPATGVVSGEIDEYGTYDFKITQTLTKVVPSSFWSVLMPETKTITKTSNARIEALALTSVNYNINIPILYNNGGSATIDIPTGATTIAQIPAPSYAPHPSFVFRGWAGSADATDPLAGDAAVPQELYAIWEFRPVTIINGTFWVNGIDTGIKPAGQQGVGILNVSSTVVGNETVVTITLSNGNTETIRIPNGVAGNPGAPGAAGEPISVTNVSSAISADGTKTIVTITFSDGSTQQFEVANGAPGIDGKDGKNGEDAAGGCNSTIAGGVGIAFAVVLVGAMIICLKKKGRKEDK